MIILPNGIGETAGDSLVTSKPFQASGQVFYVHSTTGDNTYTGLNKAQPKATLAGAQTSAANGDTIVLLDGHSESYTASLTISKNLTIVGSGSAAGIPTVGFQKSTAYGGTIFTITAAGVQLRNIQIVTSGASDAFSRISIQANSVTLDGVYVQCGANDPTAGAIQVNAAVTNLTVRNCTFVAVNTTAALAPGPGIEMSGTSTDVWLVGVVFDGGTKGFSSGVAYTELGAPTRRRGESISLLRGADVSLSLSAAQSYWMATTSTGDARIST